MAALIDIRTELGSLDLSKGSHEEFYVTRQIFNLIDFETRNADFTKTIQVPSTPNNTHLLASIADTTGTDGTVKSRIKCSISMGGIMIAPVAWLLHLSSNIDRNSTMFEIAIFYGNFNMFDQLEGQTIDKLNWAPLATNWEVADLNQKSTNTYLDKDIVFPVVDWNVRDGTTIQKSWQSYDTYIDANLAGFFLYVRNIIEKILEEAGYTLIVGTVPSDFNILALACPVTKFFEIQEVGQLSLSATVESASNQVTTGITERGRYQQVNSGNIYNLTLNQFEFNQNVSGLTVKAFGEYNYDRGHPNNPDSRIVLYHNAVEIAAFATDTSITGGDFFITTQINVIAGDTLYVQVEAANTQGLAVMTLLVGNAFQVFTPGEDLSRLVQPSEHIPQISQSKFFGNILKLFNLFLVTDDVRKTVTLNSFDTIFDNAEVDLSEKVGGGSNTINIKHSIPSLGQHTTLEWIEDNLYRRDVNTTIKFDNQVLEKEVTALSMDFSACDKSILYYNPQNGDVLLKAKIPMVKLELTPHGNPRTIAIDSNGFFTLSLAVDFEVGNFFRLSLAFGSVGAYRVVSKLSATTGMLQTPIALFASGSVDLTDVITGEAHDFEPRLALLHEDTPQPNYGIIQGSVENYDRFAEGALTASWLDSLKMDFIGLHYYGKIFNSLQTPQVITTKFNLSTIDIVNFDFTRPIYISQFNAFYYVNRISQFKIGHLTQVELIRISKGIKVDIPIPPPPAPKHKVTILATTNTTTFNRINIEGGSWVVPVGFATFLLGNTLNIEFLFTKEEPIGTFVTIVIRNVDNDVLIYESSHITQDEHRQESHIISDFPLWGGGDVSVQAIYDI